MIDHYEPVDYDALINKESDSFKKGMLDEMQGDYLYRLDFIHESSGKQDWDDMQVETKRWERENKCKIQDI